MALTSEQLKNAQIIANVGRSLGASQRDIQIALMTALQESGLRNLKYGDRDSLGLFQQRPSMGWGSKSQVTNPEYAARAFFLGAGYNKGLLDYGERNSWSLTQAAQKVQRSAYPNAYAKHEKTATEILGRIGGTTPAPKPVQGQPVPGVGVDPLAASRAGFGAGEATLGISAPGAQQEAPDPALGVSAPTALGIDSADKPVDFSAFMPQLSQDQFNEIVSGVSAKGGGGNAKAQAIIALAKQYLGTPYKWGGSSPLGFDCSGLIQYVFKKNGIDLPRVSFQQARGGTQVSRDQAQAGDLWWIDNSSRNNGADHIAIYLGNGQILEAPRTGLNVRIRDLSSKEMARGGFTRYL